ncbi:MAG: hypothetical protein OEY36_00630 [Gammaproteobacteria bacterium]|nr:hypothetical protein [Gammaproteobacteria bacterium]
MDELAAPTDSKDAAWVSFKTPMERQLLIDFCQDVSRLFRINPYLEFEKWQSCGDNCYQLTARNLSNDPPLDLDNKLQIEPREDGVHISYHDGLKSSTTFKIESVSEGSKVTIIEDYETLNESERQARLHEVDKSLTKWAEDIQAYLVRWKRWSWFAPWRWYMRKIWQPMKPTARRITYMLLWISLIEIVVIALGVSIYFVEYR